jgi:transposase
MSLQPRPWPEPADEIATAVRVMYAGRRAPLPVVIRDELGEVFADEEFAEAFADRGTPGWSPGRLALVTALQMVENLTDRQAAEAVRDKISWKYVLGLGLTDTGFEFSVLSEFRARVAGHGLEARALDLLVSALVDKGLVKARGKQRTDSTHVLAAVRDLNRLELAGESVRACLEAIAAAAPDWLDEALDVPGWASRYGARVDSWRLPTADCQDQTRCAGRRLRHRRVHPAKGGVRVGLPAVAGRSARGAGAAAGSGAELRDRRRPDRTGGDHHAGRRHSRSPAW